MMVLILMNMEWSMLNHLGRELIVVGLLFGMKGHQKKRSRTKISSFSITSRLSLVPPLGESVNKTEMSGAAKAAPRKMMREEAKLAEDDMEQTGGEVGPIPGASRETSM